MAIAACVMMLPAGWPAFALLLFLPGLSLLTLVKQRLTMVELAAIPVTLSIILFPLATLITSPVSTHGAPVLLGLTTIGIAIYHFTRGTVIELTRSSALPLLIGGAAVLYQYTLFPANSGSQIALGQHKDLTGNTHRFLTYLSLPLSLLAGVILSRWLASPKPFKMAAAFAIILLMLPSTAMIADFYNNNKVETLASAPEVKAITWLGQNVPPEAVIFEKPTYFVKVPVMAGRDVAYAGQAYTKQYHGVVYQDHMDRIQNATDPGSVSKALVNDGVDYVFIGRRESKCPFVRALDDGLYFKKVYDEGGVRIYEVLNRIKKINEKKDYEK